MEAESSLQSLVVGPVREMLTKILAYLPILLGALIILIIGWIIVLDGVYNLPVLDHRMFVVSCLKLK